MRNVGFNANSPEITRVSFRKPGVITLYLEDGRILSATLSCFPGIEKLTTNQRRRYHIQDFLDTYETNAYQSPAKQINRQLAAV